VRGGKAGGAVPKDLGFPMTPASSIQNSPTGFMDSGLSSSTSQPVPIPVLSATLLNKKVGNGFTIAMPLGSFAPDTPPATPDTQPRRKHSAHIHAPDGFLAAIFPTDFSRAAAYATPLSISQEEGIGEGAGTTWEGFVLSGLDNDEKTLYVCGQGAERVQLRESIVALLDLADEHLDCTSFVIALERNSPALAGLIHSLMYVSGQVVTNPPFEVDHRWVCVGIDI